MSVMEVESGDQPTQAPATRRYWPAIGLADVIMIFFALSILQRASSGMMDDPGLGWNLRIADLMGEKRGFLYTEEFCSPTEGRPWVTQAWLGDIVLRLAYGWGGLNGVAILTALCMAFTFRLLYKRMTNDGLHWILATLWVFLAALATSPSWIARPNLFTFPALVLVVGFCERYHTGAISANKTLWLLPIFLLWPNMHGGFLAGVLVLCVTYLVECALAVAAPDAEQRTEARRRVRWWTLLGVGIFLATLANPYGFGLYRWNVGMLRDPFIQTNTTTEWLPPNFTNKGWFRIELLVLLFPALAVLSRRRLSPVALGIGVVFLHFGLTSARYSPLWAVVVAPSLATLSAGLPVLERVGALSATLLSPDLRKLLARKNPGASRSFASVVFAGVMLFVSPWLGSLARHDQNFMPSESLDNLLSIYRGERVFHSANWGGYLTWHGWNLSPRFQTWIDDRLDVHGRQHTEGYRTLLTAPPDWERELDHQRVEILCIPSDSPLAQHAQKSSAWHLLRNDGRVALLRKASPPVALVK